MNDYIEGCAKVINYVHAMRNTTEKERNAHRDRLKAISELSRFSGYSTVDELLANQATYPQPNWKIDIANRFDCLRATYSSIANSLHEQAELQRAAIMGWKC